MANRIRNDANTRFNTINLAGNPTKSEMVIQSEQALTPGCIVVPFVGTPAATQGWDGSLGAVAAPTAAIGNLPIRVVDLGGISGMSITDEFKQGDQVPILNKQSGAQWNVRIAPSEVVAAGALLTVATNGSGFVTAAGATSANAVGMAMDELIVSNADLKTYIRMEVF